MDGLIALQGALRAGVVSLSRCKGHPDLWVLQDYPDGEWRRTYALIKKGVVQATVVFVQAEPFEGVHCVSIGFAVAESHRRKGLATRTIPRALEALRVELARSGMREFYVEAIVSISNHASGKLASRFISATFHPGVESISGEPIYQYVALLK